jgi:hypothetical protein
MQKNIMAWILFVIKWTPATGTVTVLFNANNEKKNEKGSATIVDFIINVAKWGCCPAMYATLKNQYQLKGEIKWEM